jgi:hypothetical protein
LHNGKTDLACKVAAADLRVLPGSFDGLYCENRGDRVLCRLFEKKSGRVSRVSFSDFIFCIAAFAWAEIFASFLCQNLNSLLLTPEILPA